MKAAYVLTALAACHQPDATEGGLPVDSSSIVDEGSGVKAPRTDSTPILGGSAALARVIDAPAIALPNRNYGYAYGATIIKDAGKFHLFACSTGLANGGTLDQIRYVSSNDGVHFSQPVVKVSASSGPGSLDYSACDPSIVFYGGYYYLFYSGLRAVPDSDCTDGTAHQTVVRVARSTTIDGDYEKLIWNNGQTSWAPATDTTIPDNPGVVVGPRHVRCGFYGAGQQSVVVKDGKIWMWYVDDTAMPDGTPAPVRTAPLIYTMTSTDPLNWDFYHSTLTTGGYVALDVKYDARAQAFVEIAVPWVAASGPNAGLSAIPSRYSYDGITWSNSREFVDVGHMPRWSRVEGGFSGDASGNITTGTTLVAFGCPHGGCTELGSAGPDKQPPYGYWDMWAYPLNDLSTALFDP